jgi:hypothetical protein
MKWTLLRTIRYICIACLAKHVWFSLSNFEYLSYFSTANRTFFAFNYISTIYADTYMPTWVHNLDERRERGRDRQTDRDRQRESIRGLERDRDIQTLHFTTMALAVRGGDRLPPATFTLDTYRIGLFIKTNNTQTLV